MIILHIRIAADPKGEVAKRTENGGRNRRKRRPTTEEIKGVGEFPGFTCDVSPGNGHGDLSAVVGVEEEPLGAGGGGPPTDGETGAVTNGEETPRRHPGQHDAIVVSARLGKEGLLSEDPLHSRVLPPKR